MGQGRKIASVLENYDVKLSRLSEDKIEQVRNWRNDFKVSQFMEFQKYITPEMQKIWYDSINNDLNLYYIISYKNHDVGLINVKDIDYDKNSGEGGVFIYDERYLNSDISYRAHMCLFDYVFFELGLTEIHSHIRSFNKRAIRLTVYMGFRQVSETNYSLSKDDFINNTNRLRLVNKYNKKNKQQ